MGAKHIDTKSCIRLRPHHGLCIQHYVGHGYNDQFTENMSRIIESLKNNPAQDIVLCSTTDVLCDFCPNNQNGVCESEEKVAKYDKACLSLCGFYDGQQLSWDLFKKTIAKTIIEGSNLRNICKDCSWLPLCEKVAARYSKLTFK